MGGLHCIIEVTIQGGQSMKKLYIKQKFWTLLDKFTVKNEAGNDIYYANQNFRFFGDSFTVYRANGQVAFEIEKRVFTWLPKFDIAFANGRVLTIYQELSFLKRRLQIDPQGLNYRVIGDFWDYDFTLYQGNRNVGYVQKRFFSWVDTYELVIYQDADAELFLAVVLAIDAIKDAENTTNTY